MAKKKRGCYDALFADVAALRSECDAAAKTLPESLDPEGCARNAYATMTRMLGAIIAVNAKEEVER